MALMNQNFGFTIKELRINENKVNVPASHLEHTDSVALV